MTDAAAARGEHCQQAKEGPRRGGGALVPPRMTSSRVQTLVRRRVQEQRKNEAAAKTRVLEEIALVLAGPGARGPVLTGK